MVFFPHWPAKNPTSQVLAEATLTKQTVALTWGPKQGAQGELEGSPLSCLSKKSKHQCFPVPLLVKPETLALALSQGPEKPILNPHSQRKLKSSTSPRFKEELKTPSPGPLASDTPEPQFSHHPPRRSSPPQPWSADGTGRHAALARNYHA